MRFSIGGTIAIASLRHTTHVHVHCVLVIMFHFHPVHFPQVVFVGFLLGGLFWGASSDAIGRKMVSTQHVSLN